MKADPAVWDDAFGWPPGTAATELGRPPASTTGPVTVRLSDVQAESVEWLWPGRLPAGKLVILDGDPALGKSTMALDFAARLSTGKPWPDGACCQVGATVVMSAEDGLADTIRPRLDAAGADPAKVYALTEVRYTDSDGKVGTRLPSLADLPPIEQAVTRTKARLLVVDVLMAYLGGGTDSHKDQDVRTVLHGLAALAERTRCCVLLLRHLNKTGAGSAMYRGGGSIGIIGAARAGFVVGTDPDDETRRVFAPLKSNLAAAPDALAYRLVSSGDVARIHWEGTVAHSAGDLLSRREGDDERTERDEAVEWLTDYLSEQGESSAADVKKAARAADISERTLQRARVRASITVERSGFPARSVWRLGAVVPPVVPVTPPSEPWHNWHNSGTTEAAEGSTKGAKGADSQTLPPSLPSPLPWRCVECHGLLDPVFVAEGAYWHPTCDLVVAS